MRKKHHKEIDNIFEDICKIYFPRWNPWIYKYNSKWGDQGVCDNKRKIIFFGNSDPRIIIHEICHAVSPGSHGPKWQARMLKAAEIAKEYDPVLSKRLIADKNLSSKAVKMPRTNFYNNLIDTFCTLFSENDSSSINIEHCINLSFS